MAQRSKVNSKSNKTSQSRKPKTKLKLRIPSKNPYGKLIEDPENWPPRDEIDRVLKKGPTEMKNWQSSQIEELIVPHLNGEQISTIITKLGFSDCPSLLLHKIHQKLLFEFLNNTLNSIDKINENKNSKKLVSILRHSLRFIRIAQFKQLNIEILSRIDCIPKAVLRILCDHKNGDLLSEFPINILRQIWTYKLTVFDREFKDIFNAYLDSHCNDDQSSYFDHVWRVDSALFIQLTKIKRANNDTLKRVVADIGSSPVLFNRSIANIEKYFCKSIADSQLMDWRALVSFSNFRMDISIALYDHAHRLLITENDTIWALIQIIYYKDSDCHTLNLNKSEIFEIYKLLSETDTAVSVSMFLCIPFVKSVLFKTYIFWLEQIANKQILPRESKPLSQLTHILSVAVTPNKYSTKITNENEIVLFQFNPLLIVSLLTDTTELNEDIIKWSKENALCAYILLYYFLFLLSHSNQQKSKSIDHFIDICLKNEFDSSYLLAMNGMTEINLICNETKKIQTALNQTTKCKIVRFLVMFVSQIRYEKALILPILEIVQNIGLVAADVNRFIKELRH